jgi:hypothetical protein
VPASIPCAVLAYAHDLDDVQAVIDAAFLLALHQLRRGRAPHLYESGVRYRREEHATLPGVERVQTPEETYAMGYGDCDDLAPWLAASRVVFDGRDDARPRAIESPGVGYHVVVRYGDGSIEDPSARLGMLRPEVGDAGETEAEVKVQRRRRRVRAFFRRAEALSKAAERTVPGSRARAALLEEAAKAARRAREGLEEEREGSAS